MQLNLGTSGLGFNSLFLTKQATCSNFNLHRIHRGSS
uniref:Uncharacterized protein n=1 Tax=Nelumbo nucifera TaxID=4432 RepID=A0A822YPK5_NELNU|nr:TPA_asm: hypothetical protein HUJ06_012372 [Nelumbo nucifera]